MLLLLTFFMIEASRRFMYLCVGLEKSICSAHIINIPYFHEIYFIKKNNYEHRSQSAEQG